MTTTTTFKPDRESQLWSLGVLLCAAVSFPYVMTFVVLSKIARFFTSKRDAVPMTENIGQTVIVSGGKMTKALSVCRQLKEAGCRVVLVETHKYWMVATRFSSCVDRFVTTPVPEKDTEAYFATMKRLAYEEDADLFIPVTSPVASVFESRLGRVLPPQCRSLSLGEQWTAALDDKVTFSKLAKQANLPVPDTRRMESKAQIYAFNEALLAQGASAKRYVLKNLEYDPVRRLDLFCVPSEPEALKAYVADVEEISAEKPWGVQEFIRGPEYAIGAITHNGKVIQYSDHVHGLSVYNYQYQGDERLKAWVETFCAHHELTGVICIDFIMDSDGVPRAIECNPRFSSNIVNFYDQPHVGKVYTAPDECVKRGEVLTPYRSAAETCWVAAEMWHALTEPGLTPLERARELYRGFFVKKDAYWDVDDVMPFLALHYLHIPTLLVRNILRGNKWAKIDMCIGKLTEVNGD